MKNRDGDSKALLFLLLGCLTVCVTGAGEGVDSAWEQKKLGARKMLEKPHRTLASSARCVGRFWIVQDSLPERRQHRQLD